MELTKQQIQFIENRLENNGLKHWDIRIEILDHVVSDIEQRMKNGESYNNAVESSFQYLNFNRDLENFNRQKLMAINGIVRKQYFNQVKEILSNSKYLVKLILLISLYSLTYIYLDYKIFKIVSILVLAIPICVGVFYFFREFYLNKKSGYLTYSSFYIYFSFLVLNVPLQFLQPDGIFGVQAKTYALIVFIITILNMIFSVAGILVHIRIFKKLDTTLKALSN